MPDPKPRKGPPYATEDGSVPRDARRRQSRATGTTESSPLTVAQWNAEGISRKKLELQKFLYTHSIDVVCIQETHLNPENRFCIRGYETFRLDRQGHKGGIIICVKNSLASTEIERSAENTEYLTIKIFTKPDSTYITNVYSPNDQNLNLETLQTQENRHLIVGDFNAHSPSWGYISMDTRGEEIEDWMVERNLILINNPEDPPTFYSRRWKSQSTPDIAIATEDIERDTIRNVTNQLGGSDHKPVLIIISKTSAPPVTKMPASWNYKKADWAKFTTQIEDGTRKFNKSLSVRQATKQLTDLIIKAAYTSIPRGRRASYTPFWTKELQQLHENVSNARNEMEMEPSDANKIQHNRQLAIFKKEKLKLIRNSWKEKTSSLNFEKDTTKLWSLTKSLNEERPLLKPQIVIQKESCTYTGKQVANELAQHYADESKIKICKEKSADVKRQIKKRFKERETPDSLSKPFSLNELKKAISNLKSKKSPGSDKVTNEMIQHLGHLGKTELLKICNLSWTQGILPEERREAEIIPIYKQGKPKHDKTSYRPISLLSCICKTME